MPLFRQRHSSAPTMAPPTRMAPHLMAIELWPFIRRLMLVCALALGLPAGTAFAALNDACDAGTGPASGLVTDGTLGTCTATTSLTQGAQCSGSYYYNSTSGTCVANQASCSASSAPGTYDTGACTPVSTPSTGMSCGGNEYYNGSTCVPNGTQSGTCAAPNEWTNGVCVAPPPTATPPSVSGSLSSAASSLNGLKGVVPGQTPGASGQQPICVNSSPIIGAGMFVIAGSTLCYGTAADTSGTSIYAYHTSSSQDWNGLNVQDLFSRGDITALGTLSVYGGAQLYSPDGQTGLLVVNGNVLAASSNGTNSSSVSVAPGSVTTASTGGGFSTSLTVAPGSATTSSANGSNLTTFTVAPTGTTTATTDGTRSAAFEIEATGMTSNVSDGAGQSTSVVVGAAGSSTVSSNGSTQSSTVVGPNQMASTVQVGGSNAPTDYATVTMGTNQIVNRVAAPGAYTQTSASATGYNITAVGSTSALTSLVSITDQRISLSTGNGVLASNGAVGTTSSQNSGGISVFQSSQVIASGTTIADQLAGRTYQNSVNGNLFVDGNVYINGLLEYVSSNAATTTVTNTGSSILGTGLSTSGGTSIVMKGTDAAHAVVDANGKISMQSGVSEQSSASLTLTNGLGNVHGLVVNETQATMSGGINSSSMTLDDNGATFSNSSTGAPVQVHGVADGTADFDAVNLRQLKRVAAGVAGVVAMTNIPQVEPGKTMAVGMGLGNFWGETALAVGMSYRRQNTVWRASVSSNSSSYRSSTTVGVGAGISW